MPKVPTIETFTQMIDKMYAQALKLRLHGVRLYLIGHDLSGTLSEGAAPMWQPVCLTTAPSPLELYRSHVDHFVTPLTLGELQHLGPNYAPVQQFQPIHYFRISNVLHNVLKRKGATYYMHGLEMTRHVDSKHDPRTIMISASGHSYEPEKTTQAHFNGDLHPNLATAASPSNSSPGEPSPSLSQEKCSMLTNSTTPTNDGSFDDQPTFGALPDIATRVRALESSFASHADSIEMLRNLVSDQYDVIDRLNSAINSLADRTCGEGCKCGAEPLPPVWEVNPGWKVDHAVYAGQGDPADPAPSPAGSAVDHPDMINHPEHYNDHPSGIECIEVAAYMDFCLGNAMKYIWRAGLKGDMLEDLKKAQWYLDYRIQMLESGVGDW